MLLSCLTIGGGSSAMDGAGRLSDRLGMIAAAIILALGLMIGGYLLGNGLVRAREADRSVTVRGLAERDVTADLATWTLAYSARSEEHTSELQSLMRLSYAVCCWKKKT